VRDRIAQELKLLRKFYAGAKYLAESRWLRVPGYPLPEGWNRADTDIAFQVNVDYPASPPYGIYVPAGLRYNNTTPQNYTEPAPTAPPFNGTWGIFSWAPDDGQWRPTTDLVSGSNLLNWVRGFAARFKEGV
jgi:hypothetical protein